MLSRVLLHVIEAPYPIDASLHRAQIDLPVNDVYDFLRVVADIENIRITKFPQVMRLAAGGRIKCRSIQDDFPRCGCSVYAGFAAEHFGGELTRERIVI